MKFRMLFTAAAFLALSSLAFGQPPADCYFEYPMDWDCYSHPPLQYGECWNGTPIPDGTPVNIKDCQTGGVICSFPMNSLDICGAPVGGFFVQWEACVVVSGTMIYLEVEYQGCRYWTECYETEAGYNYFGLLEADFNCQCGEPEEFDLGDIARCNYPSLPNQAAGDPPAWLNPAHMLSGICWLGPQITPEPWADPYGHDSGFGEDVLGDATDDGVAFHNLPWMPCTPQTVTITVTAGPNYDGEQLYLGAWKDGNLDGDFCDTLCDGQAPEWIIQDAPVLPGVYTFDFFDPGVFDMGIYDGIFRFRLFEEPRGRHAYGLLNQQACPNMVNGTWAVEGLGEVEDYIIESWQLPVELTSFEAVAGDRQVTLTWTTASEQNNDYFEVQRRTATSDWIIVAQVEGAGNSQTETNYEWVDRAVVNGVTYTYRLVCRDMDGVAHILDVEVEATPEAPIPVEFALYQNYPNPVEDSTTIVYDIREAVYMELTIRPVNGGPTETLVSAHQPVGRFGITFDMAGMANGLYEYQMSAGDFDTSRTLLKNTHDYSSLRSALPAAMTAGGGAYSFDDVAIGDSIEVRDDLNRPLGWVLLEGVTLVALKAGYLSADTTLDLTERESYTINFVLPPE